MTAVGIKDFNDLQGFLSIRVLPNLENPKVTRVVPLAGGGLSHEHYLCYVKGQVGSEMVRKAIILRRVPKGGPLEPYDIEQEFHSMRLLAHSGVPVPRVCTYCKDPSVWERPFMAMEYVPGWIPDYRNLTDFPLWQRPDKRKQMAREIMKMLAALQGVDWKELGFAQYLPQPKIGTAALQHLLSHWRAMYERHSAAWPRIPILKDALLWLEANAPECSDLVLVHGDFRVGNFIFRHGRIVAVLDWEGILIGDPMQDLGYLCHPIMREKAPALMCLLVEQAELFEMYEEFSGRHIDKRRFHYYLIYALFFHGVTILVGFDQALKGTASDFRIAKLYRRLNKVTRYLCDELEAS